MFSKALPKPIMGLAQQMLTAIRISDMAQVIASDATKRTGPFRCPNCKAPLSLRKGTHNLSHFAHKRPITCDYGKGETLAHRRCKLEIYARLRMHPAAREVKLEHHLGAVRPDVFAYILGKPVAIEVQLSTLSPERIATRTTEYTKRGISVLWLMQWTPKLDAHRYSPKRFERWLHAAYYGRVYYWQEGLTIVPYSFQSHLIHIDE